MPSGVPRCLRRVQRVSAADDCRAKGMKSLMAEVDAIVRRYPGVDPDDIRHTLLLLREKPIDRLRMALIRGRGAVGRKRHRK